MTKLEMVADPNKQEIIMTRTFDAPRERVFKAFVTAEQVKKWWGGSLFETTVEEFNPKAGGSWRFYQTDDRGTYHFHGVFHDVTPDERIIQTFEYDDLPEAGHVILETIKFEEVDGKTVVTDISTFQSVSDRDGMIQSGMETGASASWDALAKIVEKD